MKKVPAAVIFAALLITFTTAGCGQTNDPTPAAPDVQITLGVEPDPPSVGQATLIITLKDAQGAPVDGATVKARGDMDHAGMMPVAGETDAGTNGVYRIPFEWTMGGGWILTVTAALPGGGEVTQTFDLFVEAASSESIINRQKDHTTGNGTAAPMEMTPTEDK